MPRLWVLASLFLSSYLPLFVLVGLRSIGHSEPILVASAVLSVLGVIGTALFLLTARRKTSGEYELRHVENRDPDLVAYAATYLLPFLTIFSAHWQDVASLAAFIGFLGFVYVRSRLVYVNPTLTLLGYRLWRVVPVTAGTPVDAVVDPWPRFLLARDDNLRHGRKITARDVTDDLLLAISPDS